MEMTQGALRQLCIKHKLYRTPHLNDKLYCNFQGFTRIDNLEEYHQLKALFLEGNALRSLVGMPMLDQLKCLYVQNNALTSLAGLDKAPNLDSINVSCNLLTSLECVEACPQLNSIIAESNQLEKLAGLAPLAACTHLHTLDLQRNRIDDVALLDLLRTLPQLRCLYLRGNPVVSAIPNYRKTVVAALPALTYLDDRPVLEEERRCCEAWARGGLEEERAERMRCKEEAATASRRSFEFMQELRRSSFQKRRAMMGLPPSDTDPVLDAFSDDEYQLPEEGDDLRRARAQLGAYLAGVNTTEATSARAGSAGNMACDDAVAEDTLVKDGRDGELYLASVRRGQRELDAAGAALLAHPGLRANDVAAPLNSDAPAAPTILTREDGLHAADQGGAGAAQSVVVLHPGSNRLAPDEHDAVGRESHAAVTFADRATYSLCDLD